MANSDAMNPSLIAIKHGDADDVLDILQNCYSSIGLGLVEERIGSRSGKYATSPKQYPDIQTYLIQERSGPHRGAGSFTSDFELVENREKSLAWKILRYQPKRAELTVNIDSELAQELSHSLKTIVIEYLFEFKQGADFIVVRAWDNGDLKDELLVTRGAVVRGKGAFGDSVGDEVGDVLEAIYGYGEEHELDLEYADLDSDKELIRPMYIKGKPDVLKTYLAKIKHELSSLEKEEAPLPRSTVATNTKQRDLSRSDIGSLEMLLGYAIYCPQQFFERKDGQRTFYDFLTEVLEEHNNRVVRLDWRWDPEDLFWFLGRIFPQYGFRLLRAEPKTVGGQTDGYSVAYVFHGKQVDDYIKLGGLVDWIDRLNLRLSEISNLQLALNDVTGDEYIWFLVTRGFNANNLGELISVRA